MLLIRFESHFNWLFQFQPSDLIVAMIQFEFGRRFRIRIRIILKLVKFNQKWSKITGFHHFHHYFDIKHLFWYNLLQIDNWMVFFDLLIKNRLKVIGSNRKKVRIQLTIIKKLSNLDQNPDRQLESVVGFRIRPMTIEFGFQIWFDDDASIRNP